MTAPMNVYKKLQSARSMLQKIDMKKTGINKFAGYNYFELSDFLNPIQEIFNGVGLCGTVSFGNDVASLTIRDTDKPDDFIVFESRIGSASLKGAHEIQNIGAVQTYHRRYLYVMAMEIVEHDAIDSQPSNDKAEVKKDSIKESVVNEEEAKAVDQIVELLKMGTDDNNPKLLYDNFNTIEPRSVKEAVWFKLDAKTKATLNAEIKLRGKK